MLRIGRYGDANHVFKTFFDALTDYRIARGQHSVSIALPVVLDVGYVADRDLTDKLSKSLGATLNRAQIECLVKGAIIGPSSGLNRDGKAISFRFSSGEDRLSQPWQSLRPFTLVKLINSRQQALGNGSSGQGPDARVTGLHKAGKDDLLEALMSKVSSITMIDRDEVEPDVPLANYSLDSLVSVELRNWIRRETGVELPLPKIVGAANLRALGTHIISQRDKKSGDSPSSAETQTNGEVNGTT